MTKCHKLHSLRSSLNRSQVFSAAFPSLATGGLNYNKINGPPRTQDLFLATTKLSSTIISGALFRRISKHNKQQQKAAQE